MLKPRISREILTVIISIAVQVPLAIFLGHYYDGRSFIDTGWGWENTKRRFSWAGLNYSLRPNCKIFNYSIRLRSQRKSGT